MIRLVLPYPLSANRYWRPVPIGGHITIVPTKEAKAYKADVVALALRAGVRKPFVGRVKVDLQLFPQRPQDWQKRVRLDPLTWDDTVRCIDLDNARKVLYDALKGVAFEDDSRIFEDTGRRMEPDGEARVVVTITPLALAAHPQGDLLGAAA